MSVPLSYYELVEQFPKGGCVLCHLLARDGERFLGALLYEYVMEYDVQQAFRASRGLCNGHGWQMTQHGNALGVAILHKAALDEVLDIVQKASASLEGNGRFSRGLLSPMVKPQNMLAGALANTSPCAVCAHQAENLGRYLRVFGDSLEDERFHQAFARSDGLCLAHFRTLLDSLSDTERARRLVETQTDIWRSLQGELAEFIRKSDFQHVNEKMGAEGDSWRRAIARLSGEPGADPARRGKP